MLNTAVVLPQALEKLLVDAYADYQSAWRTAMQGDQRVQQATRFANLVLAAREAGWPLRTISDACGLSSRRVRAIVDRYGSSPEALQGIPPGPVLRSHLTTAQASEVRDLYWSVASARGEQSRDPLDRHRSRQFIALLLAHRGNGVPWAELAAATGKWRRWPVSGRKPVPGAITVSALQGRILRAEGTLGAAAQRPGA